ncbi:hypothetical protein BGX21_005157 [Mortierella sp. AD011]|nr:hypothetical protein BGX20_009159 [Mortierella sp. AD010]KAF9400023.1 hypothetical protein BGX21_005157 [Mortierella sp. AD011]
MSAEQKGNAPAPLDPFGNEVCLLFLKYGKCRYKKKCKKSHILPDKNAPIMQKVTEFVAEQPAVKTVPKVAFSVRMMPYAKPSPTAVKPQTQKLRGVTGRSDHGSSQRLQSTAGNISNLSTGMDGVDQTVVHTPSASSADVASVSKEDSQDTVPKGQQPLERVKQKKPKPKRPPKAPSKCLLASLFRTNISSPEVQSAVDTFVIGQQQTRTKVPIQSINSSTNPTRKSRLRPKSKPTAPVATSAFSTNVSEASSEKIEQWYITNKAHLENVPESMPGGGGTPRRRLMVLNKPTTARQKSQLKIMRKHHWECRIEVEHNLKRNLPTIFSLKIARTKIDWEKVVSYVTLMIQAAFEMDIDHIHLPVIGTTLCLLLEKRGLSAKACEELLASWGLTELNARRFTNHLWELLVSAAGEASVRGGKGVGFKVPT